MDFRWAAGIALWTLLSGPVFVHLQTLVSTAPTSKADSAPVVRVRPVSTEQGPVTARR
jgi:hypothetical protein